MENSELINVILTSSLIASVLSAIISLTVSIKLKNLDFKNEYYKIILGKRLEAYKYLEAQIAVLKSSVLDEDGKSYYTIFAYGEEKFYEFQQNLFAAQAYNMWINDKTAKEMDKLNDLFYTISRKIESKEEAELIRIGKEHYHEIVKHRRALELSVREDLLNLYNLRKFRKSKILNGRRIIRLD